MDLLLLHLLDEAFLLDPVSVGSARPDVAHSDPEPTTWTKEWLPLGSTSTSDAASRGGCFKPYPARAGVLGRGHLYNVPIMTKGGIAAAKH